MISYAQNAEDVVLARVFGERTDGFFVDIGANDPTQDSVTRHFYERGWHGLNVEPQATCFAALQAARPRDINLNVGVGSSAGRLRFYLVPEAQAMSTFSSDHAELVRRLGYRTEQTDIEVRTLDNVFAEHVGDRAVDFLKVDVEGLEEEVLGTFDWTRWRPRVLVVESSPDVSPWEGRLREAGYQRTLWDGINLFLVREEDAAEMGPALARPATMVLDKYDPWLYVEQLTELRRQLEVLLQHYLVRALQKRAASPDDPEVTAAARALGTVLSERRDVVEHFGAPPDIDLSGLLSWASRGKERIGELYVEPLVSYHSVYAQLASARQHGVTDLTELRKRASEKVRPFVPPSVRRQLDRMRNHR
jgi:FkbM family methyltransferase